jgi:elongation factor G
MILLWLAIDPHTAADRENLDRALQKMTADDPGLAVKRGADGVVRLGGESEDHLEAAVRRLVHEFAVQAAVDRLEIAYKEAVTVSAGGEAKYAHHSGGRGQYAHVKVLVQPAQEGSGFVFENLIVGGAIPDGFVTPIEESIRGARGVLAGYPIEDVHVTLYDGSYHEVDSSAEAFRIAAVQAFRDAVKKAHPVLLEPIMSVVLIVPSEHLSRAEAMLSARRGVLLRNALAASEWATVSARVPLSETFGLAAELRERSGGRGICTIRFDHYAPAAHADDDGDRDAPVTWPTNPRTPLRTLKASVPEPTGDDTEPPA